MAFVVRLIKTWLGSNYECHPVYWTGHGVPAARLEVHPDVQKPTKERLLGEVIVSTLGILLYLHRFPFQMKTYGMIGRWLQKARFPLSFALVGLDFERGGSKTIGDPIAD